MRAGGTPGLTPPRSGYRRLPTLSGLGFRL